MKVVEGVIDSDSFNLKSLLLQDNILKRQVNIQCCMPEQLIRVCSPKWQ